MNKIFELTQAESQRQQNSLNLIASENYPSPKVLSLLGSIWNDKYAEGYPGKRYYAGNVLVDELEEFVQSKALELFDPTGEYSVNAQVLSGSPANAMVYLTVLNAGDTVLSLDLASGGHLSHLHSTSSYLKFFKHQSYNLSHGPAGYELDIDDFIKKIQEYKPKLVVLGFSSYPRKYEFEQYCQIAHRYGCLVLADIAHIAGLVAVGEHSSPFVSGDSGADFVTTTTHKTLRGPRSALLFAKNDHISAINKTVFPGTSGGPHLNQIAAVGQCLLEALNQDKYPDKLAFKDYISAVLANTRALEDGLVGGGVELSSSSQNHLTLVKLPENVDSLELQQRLESCGVITNRNAIPNDVKSPWKPGGLRLGMPALTSRGLSIAQANSLGQVLAEAILGKIDSKALQDYTNKLVASLNWWYE